MRFPPVDSATEEGVVAVGGDLSTKRLIEAYSEGIFPWFDHGSLIMWWSPDPRMVLPPSEVKVSKSMRNIFNRQVFKVTYNKAFDQVIRHCASISRKGQDDTWITQEMIQAYNALYQKGIAKSVEVWYNSELVGGLYGIDLGHVFCGESMFSLMSNASKIALISLSNTLEAKKYHLIDCQMYTDHLASMGAREIPRKDFIKILKSTKSDFESPYI
ncbi:MULTISPECIES: leucyl/phenylalanyl-tRNA--protein transferase [Galbibacter]|uniref:Leucyl/phenylalanyl-tRNA--protein transferase n=1 Tax=Galbibacter marinus TaxID=555500 RepID=K2PVD7_9FLAO|nr:leucyl/phenylalanyl-tRNA--protein transferase [Galbibacter marinus]